MGLSTSEKMAKIFDLPLQQGFDDGSGQKYIVTKPENFLFAKRWGCSCCEDLSDLKDEEIAQIQAAIVAINNHDSLVSALRSIGESGCNISRGIAEEAINRLQ